MLRAHFTKQNKGHKTSCAMFSSFQKEVRRENSDSFPPANGLFMSHLFSNFVSRAKKLA